MARFLHGTNEVPTSSRTSSTVAIGQKERINGWTCPWHPLQFIAWFFLVLFAVIYFGISVPHLPSEWKPAGYIIPGSLYVIHLIFHLMALSIDPADENIRGGPLKEKASFNRNLHEHVIENNHCHICEADVSPTSKHCSVCNKCVSDFDHHCKWLNTCVGGRNYKLFIGCVSSAFICSIIMCATDLYLFIIYFINKTYLLQSQSDGILKLFLPVSDMIFVIFVGAAAGLLLLAVILLGHLLGFHIYIMCLNMSTYDYIVNSRERKGQSRDIESGCETPAAGTKRFKNNKVKPVPDDLEISENRRIELSDNEESVASTETPNETAVKIMNEVSSKAVKRHGSPPVPARDDKPSVDEMIQSPGIVFHKNSVEWSSEESLKELDNTPPTISVQPPSDSSRPSTSSPQITRKSDISQSQAEAGNSKAEKMDQSAFDKLLNDEKSDKGMSNAGRDESEEELLPVINKTPLETRTHQLQHETLNQNVKKKKKKKPRVDEPEGNGPIELTRTGVVTPRKKKKKRPPTPDPIDLPRLMTRGRPLPSLESYHQGESPC